MSTTTNGSAATFALDTDLLKPEAVAHLLQVSVSKAKRMILDGQIESVRVGGNRRVRRRDLDRYIEGLSTCS